MIQSITFRLLLALVLLGGPALAMAQTEAAEAAAPETALDMSRVGLIQPGDRLGVSCHFGTHPADEPYLLAPGDEIYLDFRYAQDLGKIFVRIEEDKYAVRSRVYFVQPDGSLGLTGLNDPVHVADKTTTQVAALIRQAYVDAEILSHPDMAMNIIPKYERENTLKELYIGGEDERPYLSLLVDPEGELTAPLIEALAAAGRKPAEVARAIGEKYREMGYRYVTVTVWIEQPRARMISVLGAVRNPGAFELEKADRLWTAVALAGGFEGMTGRAGLFRPGLAEGRQMYDFGEYVESGDEALNPRLWGGELIIVPTAGGGQ